MTQLVQTPERHLRLAYIWNGSLQADDVFRARRPLVIGTSAKAHYPVPDNVAVDELTLLEPGADMGYTLNLSAQMGGDVWVGGKRHAVRDLAAQTQTVSLGPDDYGVITLGTVAFFFQHVNAAKDLPRSFVTAPAGLIASVCLSLFVHVAAFVMSFLVIREFPDRDPVELPADLLARFLVTPPPDDLWEETPRSGDEDSGAFAERDEAAAAEESASSTGEPAPRTEAPPSDPVASSVRDLGTLGALAESNAVSRALDIPDIGDLLSGIGPSNSRGRSPFGMGPRGIGDGDGDGDGDGRIGANDDAFSMIGDGPGMGPPIPPGRMTTERVPMVTRGPGRFFGDYLSSRQIHRVVRRTQPAIRYCYEVEANRQPSLQGTVTVNWRIGLSGRVSGARIVSSSLRNGRAEGCILRQIRRMQFPEPDGGEVSVTFPFIFQSQ